MTPSERYLRYGTLLFIIMLLIVLAVSLQYKIQSTLVALLFMMVFVAWAVFIFLVPSDETRREEV